MYVQMMTQGSYLVLSQVSLDILYFWYRNLFSQLYIQGVHLKSGERRKVITTLWSISAISRKKVLYIRVTQTEFGKGKLKKK